MNNESIRQRLETFFEAYAARINSGLADPSTIDVGASAAAYAECFIEAPPKGVICFRNDQELRQSIPKILEAQRSLGAQAMKIANLTLTPLDDYHTMAKIHWQARYIKPDQTEVVVNFDEIYFVQTIGETTVIFAYIAGDQEQLFKDKGLIPANAG